MTSVQHVTLEACDGQQVSVPIEVACMCIALKNMFDVVPLPNVTGPLLVKVFEFYTYHHEHPDEKKPDDGLGPDDPDLCEWDRQFINSLDQETLFAMVMATNYLDAKLLMDVSCVKLASMIRGKTAEQIRETFGLPKDLTEEEKEQLRQEDKWCVENGVDHNGEPVQ